MLVEFQRTGDRRYAVSVTRAKFPDLEMNPAPGYDSFLPHDVLHLVVEAFLGLKQGIFGQLAQGGTAGTFYVKTNDSHRTTRQDSRERRRLKKRGSQLAKSGAKDSAQSEGAAYVCWQEWLSRSDSALHQKQARSMAGQAQRNREALTEEESEHLNTVMDNICQYLDTISAHWHSLKVEESLQVRWPDLTVSVSESQLR